MNRIINALILAVFSCSTLCAQAVESQDFFRSTGKIYVVVAVILALFAGIVYYLIRLDRKLTQLEKHFKNEQ